MSDLESRIGSASKHKREDGVTVPARGFLRRLEAAKSMMDINASNSVKLLDCNRWALARQLDGDIRTLDRKKNQGAGLTYDLATLAICSENKDLVVDESYVSYATDIRARYLRNGEVCQPREQGL
ncbi:hypothetical protein EMCG_01277 [[Emmonsia] crescens]|uniref:Uncharacterized protein n=1 Tax=[Emmonsia] crescens TaxID=73230 RepID=A0A0G2J3W1_9EURO|nr:hypothetical protein EMCG_01277 [Emmonsia crescens UAMH 3008]